MTTTRTKYAIQFPTGRYSLFNNGSWRGLPKDVEDAYQLDTYAEAEAIVHRIKEWYPKKKNRHGIVVAVEVTITKTYRIVEP